jgi:hypothetical protein
VSGILRDAERQGDQVRRQIAQSAAAEDKAELVAMVSEITTLLFVDQARTKRVLRALKQGYFDKGADVDEEMFNSQYRAMYRIPKSTAIDALLMMSPNVKRAYFPKSSAGTKLVRQCLARATRTTLKTTILSRKVDEFKRKAVALHAQYGSVMDTFPFGEQGQVDWEVTAGVYRLLPEMPAGTEPKDHVYTQICVFNEVYVQLPEEYAAKGTWRISDNWCWRSAWLRSPARKMASCESLFGRVAINALLPDLNEIEDQGPEGDEDIEEAGDSEVVRSSPAKAAGTSEDGGSTPSDLVVSGLGKVGDLKEFTPKKSPSKGIPGVQVAAAKGGGNPLFTDKELSAIMSASS